MCAGYVVRACGSTALHLHVARLSLANPLTACLLLFATSLLFSSCAARSIATTLLFVWHHVMTLRVLSPLSSYAYPVIKIMTSLSLISVGLMNRDRDPDGWIGAVLAGVTILVCVPFAVWTLWVAQKTSAAARSEFHNTEGGVGVGATEEAAAA